MKETKLTVPGKVVYLSKIREFIKEKAVESGIEDRIASKLQFAVSEACTNVMEHGYKNEKDKDITVEVKVQGARFLATILDHGKVFDPTSVKLPDIDVIIAKRKGRGYGIYLIRKIMDELEYQVKPGIGNELRLIKYLHKNKGKGCLRGGEQDERA